MAAYLNELTKKRMAAKATLSLVFMAASCAFAEQLPDPTRPPAFIAVGSEQSAAAAPVLQSVLISPTRVVAVISGQTVKVGDKFGEARVIKIAESEVVLRNGQDVQVLKLFPNVEKRLASSRINTK